jgi:O-antigen ligase
MSTILQRPVLEPARRRPIVLGGLLGLAGTVLSTLLSFEMVVALYLYSNVFQVVLPPLPVDTTVVLFALSVALGGLVILREGIYLRGLYLVMAFMPYLLWAALSLAWTPSSKLVYDNLALLFTVDLWLLIVGAMILAHKRARMMRFLTLLAVLSLVVAAMGVYVYLVYGSFKYAGWDVTRVYNEWGRAVANGTIVLLILFLRSRFASARQLVLGTLLALCTFFILISSSRSSLLVVAAPAFLFMVVYVAPFGRQGLALSRAQILMLLVAAMVVATVTTLLSAGYRIDTVNRLLKVLTQAENTDLIMGANRFDYYAAALRYFFESPLIGHGVRSFSLLHRGVESPGVHAHNIFLEILADSGVIGFAAFALLLLMAVRPLTLTRLRSDPMMLCVTMLFAGRFTAAMFGADLAYQNVLFLAIGLLALKPAPVVEEALEEDEAEEDRDQDAWETGVPGEHRWRPTPPGQDRPLTS